MQFKLERRIAQIRTRLRRRRHDRARGGGARAIAPARGMGSLARLCGEPARSRRRRSARRPLSREPRELRSRGRPRALRSRGMRRPQTPMRLERDVLATILDEPALLAEYARAHPALRASRTSICARSTSACSSTPRACGPPRTSSRPFSDDGAAIRALAGLQKCGPISLGPIRGLRLAAARTWIGSSNVWPKRKICAVRRRCRPGSIAA